jgi:hypothetical protein
MAYIEGDQCELVSRKGKAFKSFGQLRAELARLGRTAILDAKSSVWTPPGSHSFASPCVAAMSLSSTLSIVSA